MDCSRRAAGTGTVPALSHHTGRCGTGRSRGAGEHRAACQSPGTAMETAFPCTQFSVSTDAPSPAQPTSPSTQVVQCSARRERRSEIGCSGAPTALQNCLCTQVHSMPGAQQDLLLQEGAAPSNFAPHTLLLDPATCSLHFTPQNTMSTSLSRDSSSTPYTTAPLHLNARLQVQSPVRELRPRAV